MLICTPYCGIGRLYQTFPLPEDLPHIIHKYLEAKQVSPHQHKQLSLPIMECATWNSLAVLDPVYIDLMYFSDATCISCICSIILYKDMISDNIDIKTMMQSLSDLNQLRTKYIFSLLHGKSMIHGMPHFIYRKCGKKNCKCTKGNRHGPYAALSINKHGKQRVAIIRKSDTYPVMKEAKRYRYFQETLSRIRKINREIDTLLEKVKAETTNEYTGP